MPIKQMRPPSKANWPAIQALPGDTSARFESLSLPPESASSAWPSFLGHTFSLHLLNGAL